jgi:hypothetical protein
MILAAILVGLMIIGLMALAEFIKSCGRGDMDVGIFFGGLLTIFCVIEIGIIIDITNKPKPTAMDVYQGKTTLEYTIKDSVKIDSVVVWKEERK